MARSKEFEPAVVLDRAMDLFWRQGYHATSMADLTDHLGIGRASLYATFGSKHDLYVRALDRYRQTRSPSAVDLLAQPGPALPAVRTLIDSWAAPAPPGEPDGCFIVNAAVESSSADHDVARTVDTDWNELETALTGALIRARAQGELAETTQPRPLARLLLVLLQGMQVMQSCSGNRDRLRDAADQAAVLLSPPADRPASGR